MKKTNRPGRARGSWEIAGIGTGVTTSRRCFAISTRPSCGPPGGRADAYAKISRDGEPDAAKTSLRQKSGHRVDEQTIGEKILWRRFRPRWKRATSTKAQEEGTCEERRDSAKSSTARDNGARGRGDGIWEAHDREGESSGGSARRFIAAKAKYRRDPGGRGAEVPVTPLYGQGSDRSSRSRQGERPLHRKKGRRQARIRSPASPPATSSPLTAALPRPALQARRPPATAASRRSRSRAVATERGWDISSVKDPARAADHQSDTKQRGGESGGGGAARPATQPAVQLPSGLDADFEDCRATRSERSPSILRVHWSDSDAKPIPPHSTDARGRDA